MLRRSGIDTDGKHPSTAGALVLLNNTDVRNVHGALMARDLDPTIKIVVQMVNPRLGHQLRSLLGDCVVVSGPSLAAPAFAATMAGPQVIDTIPVGRHALLVTEIPVVAGSPLDGRPLADVAQPGEVRLLAHARPGQKADWSADPRVVITAGDRLTVVARRAGLTALLRETTPPPPDDPPGATGGSGPGRGP